MAVSQRLVEVADRGVRVSPPEASVIALHYPEVGPPDERRRKLRVDVQGGVKIGHSRFERPQLRTDAAALGQRERLPGVQFQGPVEVLQRPLKVVLRRPRQAAR